MYLHFLLTFFWGGGATFKLLDLKDHFIFRAKKHGLGISLRSSHFSNTQRKWSKSRLFILRTMGNIYNKVEDLKKKIVEPFGTFVG